MGISIDDFLDKVFYYHLNVVHRVDRIYFELEFEQTFIPYWDRERKVKRVGATDLGYDIKDTYVVDMLYTAFGIP